MEFEWDENKNRSNLAKHGIGFEDVLPAFRDVDALIEIDRDVAEDERWRLIGFNTLTLVFVVYTQSHDIDSERIRIVSARKASRGERRRYERAQDGSSYL